MFDPGLLLKQQQKQPPTRLSLRVLPGQQNQLNNLIVLVSPKKKKKRKKKKGNQCELQSQKNSLSSSCNVGKRLVILLFVCVVGKCFEMFYVFSFPPGVYVGTLNLIASIPGLSILILYVFVYRQTWMVSITLTHNIISLKVTTQLYYKKA